MQDRAGNGLGLWGLQSDRGESERYVSRVSSRARANTTGSPGSIPAASRRILLHAGRPLISARLDIPTPTAL